METLLIFLGGVIAILIIVMYYFITSKTPVGIDNSTAKQGKKFSGNVSENEMAMQQRKLANTVATDFQRIGWGKFGPVTHIGDDQFRRMERAVISARMKIMSTKPEQECVYVHGDREEGYRIDKYGCSCPDFEERYLPCKHIYFLVFKLVGEHPDEDIKKIQRLFSTMPDWKEWPYGIHKESAQFVRLRLALVDDSGISVMCYDPKYKLAKILDKKYGNKGKIYLTDSRRCGCTDFQKRRYPCKHMYALAAALDGDTEKYIIDHEHSPLHGIKFTRVGHFPSKSKNYVGVQEELANLSGPFMDDLPYYAASAILLGDNPSEKRQLFVKESGLEVFTLENVRELFQNQNREGVTE